MTSTSKSWAIPTLSAVGLLAGGCVDPTVGDWEIVALDGEDMPLSYTVGIEGASCSLNLSGDLEIGEELTGELTLKVQGVCTAFGVSVDYTATSDYDLTVEVEKWRKEYTITLEDMANTDEDGNTTVDDFTLSCELQEKVTLVCEDEDGDSFEAEKQGE